ncbi:MAG: phosphodiester glycosidase family protein [Clostridiales bacterium]|nr:phosphodiester glycosidase family protein [Clostridiales bacterium]MCD7827518.1 phosphodiester glycosidase family protein [Clostridiales bacterium]
MDKHFSAIKKITAVFLSVLMLAMVFAPSVCAASVEWLDSTLLYSDTYVTSGKSYTIVNGVTERYTVLNNAAKSNQVKCYSLEIDLSNPDISIIASYNDGDTDEWKRSTVLSQASAMESKYGVNVVGGINGDMYNSSTGEPSGLLVMSGVVCHVSNNRPYFAILNDGTAVIRSGNTDTSDVAEAVGGHLILVKNGKVATSSTDYLAPRTAIGIKADGTVVMFVADGRQSPSSCGMNNVEIAYAMLALGCVDALSLDGGGSSTLISKREAGSSLTTKNTPSYAGIDRAVSDALLVCSTAEPTGVFDHIAFTESEFEVAPLHSTTVKAYAVDINGYSTSYPSGGSLVLEDSSYGILVGNLFTASQKTGSTNLNYVVDGEVIASTTITVTNDAPTYYQQFIQAINQLIANIRNMIELLKEKIPQKLAALS